MLTAFRNMSISNIFNRNTFSTTTQFIHAPNICLCLLLADYVADMGSNSAHITASHINIVIIFPSRTNVNVDIVVLAVMLFFIIFYFCFSVCVCLSSFHFISYFSFHIRQSLVCVCVCLLSFIKQAKWNVKNVRRLKCLVWHCLSGGDGVMDVPRRRHRRRFCRRVVDGFISFLVYNYDIFFFNIICLHNI